MKPFPGILTRSKLNGSPYVLTPEQQAWLCRWFPETENARLAKAMGVAQSTMHRLARGFGLTKSEKGLRGIRKRQAAKAKRICEKNGYYDSIRGKSPHPNSIVGTHRMWQEIRDGKREHPFAILKHKHPRRYKQCMQRKSEERRHAMKMERARMLYGLPRKTKLTKVVLTPYKRTQLARRYNALRRGYILADTCAEGSGHRYTIYYDNTTTRSPRFEQNCIKDGFRFKPWEN